MFVAGAHPDPVPSTGSDRDPRWWLSPYGRWRLEQEMHAMERFPSFRLVDTGQRLHWAGGLRGALSSSQYTVRVEYASGFPALAPRVIIEDPPFVERTPHLIDGRQPCLFMASDGPRHGYDPGRTTAATLVAWTTLWIAAYETWRATAEWPGRQA